MATLIDEPLLTESVDREEFDCVPRSLYIFGGGSEQRAAIAPDWMQRQVDCGVVFAEVAESPAFGSATYTVDGVATTMMLSSASQAAGLLDAASGGAVYLDITGLAHHITAPLLRAAVLRGGETYVIYMEPQSYRASRHPQRGAFFDLSDASQGIRPLPTFAYLRADPPASILVPLLGFEGSRLEQVIGHVEPAAGATFPIVGVPGFRADYPFAAYWGNEAGLLSDDAWCNIRFAIANDPFDVFHQLVELREAHPDKLIKVAPIGTKPHAVGALLFALSRPALVEVIYDHPLRRPNRTSGSARLCAYDIGTFVGSDLFVPPPAGA